MEKENHFTYVVSTPETIRSLAEIAISRKLHSSKKEYVLKPTLSRIANDERTRRTMKWLRNKQRHSRHIYVIALCFAEGKPVGIFVLDAFFAQVYVRTKYRKMGIASELYTRLMKAYDLTSQVYMRKDSAGACALMAKFNIPEYPR